jgi:general secretion pathway protein G
MKVQSKSITSVALVVFGFIALVLLATPKDNFGVARRQREAILKTDLRAIRDAIDNYTMDRKQRPRSLQDLVNAGYLRTVPVDPMTGKPDWVLDFEDPTLESPTLGDPVLSPDLVAGRLNNVHSNSSQVDLNGDAYRTW